MTNNNNHHSNASVFHQQSDTTIEQISSTPILVGSVPRTNSYHPACLPRIHPLNAASGFSRVSARPPAEPTGEWSNHPTQTHHRKSNDIRNRPDSIPTHIHLSRPNTEQDPHKRRVVTLIHFDSSNHSSSRPNSTPAGTTTGSKMYTSGHTASNRGVPPIDPDTSLKAFTPLQRPPRAVRQDKGVLTNAPPATSQPGPVEKGQRSRFLNKDSPRSQTYNSASASPC